VKSLIPQRDARAVKGKKYSKRPKNSRSKLIKEPLTEKSILFMEKEMKFLMWKQAMWLL
jgi:hypothetical protein